MGCRRFLIRTKWDRERREEIESYIQIETEDNIARGMRPTRPGSPLVASLGTPHWCERRFTA